MDETLKDNFAEHKTLAEDISQANIDKWDRTSNIALSLVQRIDQLEAFVAEQRNNEWESKTSIPSNFISSLIEIPLTIKTTFKKLEEDFDSISRRIVWCDELKESLLSFEDELEDHDVKYLSWFVSTLRDIFAYNYAEQLTYEQLMVLKEGLEIIYEKNIRCDKKAFEEYYSMLVVSGLSLLPTSSKAINEFGE